VRTESGVTSDEEAAGCATFWRFVGDSGAVVSSPSSGKVTLRFWGESRDGSALSEGLDGDFRGEADALLVGETGLL